jgi:hypothetical protein
VYESEAIKVAIERPYDQVYDLLLDADFFGKWAVNPNSVMKPLGDSDWLVELPRGAAVIRFTPKNPFGVLDYQTFNIGETSGPVTPVRLIRNDNGCELVLVWQRRPGVSAEKFKSDAQWVASDLERLKSLIEGG